MTIGNGKLESNRARKPVGRRGLSLVHLLASGFLLASGPGFAEQGFRDKTVYFGDAHWHSCLSQDAARETTLTGQFQSMLLDYGLDFSLQSDHAEAAEAGIPFCDSYLPFRGVFDFYHDNEIATAMKQAADDWNGVQHGSIRFVTFPGYEWAPDSRCWQGEPFGPDSNVDNNTPGHINYFFSNTTGWSYGPDVWEPGSGDGDLCELGTDTGLAGYYNGSRDWMDEILGQLIHQRDDPDRDYDLLIQYNHPAASLDKGGSTDHVAKWFDLEHTDANCSAKPGGLTCTSERQCETFRRAYGVTSGEWYANQEAALGSTEIHPYRADDPQCDLPFIDPDFCEAVSQAGHDAYHRPGRFVMSRGLLEGFDLASFGGSDSHGGRKNAPSGFPGEDRGAGARSLTAVYATEATRPAIWDGLARRRTYGLSRLRGMGPVHKGRVDFFSPDPVGNELPAAHAAARFASSVVDGAPTPEIGMGELAEALIGGSPRDFTVAAAPEQGTTGVYPRELRIYAVGNTTSLSFRTDVPHVWLDDVAGDHGKLGILLGRFENVGGSSGNPPAEVLSHTFENVVVHPGDAVFAVVIFSDDVWVDDYYDMNGEKLDGDGDGLPDPGKVPASYGPTDACLASGNPTCGNNTVARTTPIFFRAADERAHQTAFCSTVGFNGSPHQTDDALGAGDGGKPGDAQVLPVAVPGSHELEWNEWTVSAPADYQYADLTFYNSSDEDDLGHLFAVRVDGRLLYSGRAGIDHDGDALVTVRNLPFALGRGLHKIEVHMDDQEYALESSDNYHCNDYDGPPGYLDAIVFHNGSGHDCEDVTPPEITCPADVTAECSAHGGAPDSHPVIAAFLAGASATDDADPDPRITSDAPSFFATGATEVTFTATDAAGNSATCSAAVTVADTTAPSIISPFSLTPATLLPPDHSLIEIAVPVVVAGDACDPAPRIVCTVDSDEVVDGNGDGSTLFDIVLDGEPVLTQGTGPIEIATLAGSGSFSLALRAERAGVGDGRVYHASCEAVDAAGLRSPPSGASVEVPR